MVFKKIHGAGLLEIMIALLISAILLAEIFRYSYCLEKTLNFSAAKVESIEKMNVLFAWMVRDIEMAGYVGCVNAHSREKIIDDGHYLSSTWLFANSGALQSQYMSSEQFEIIEKLSETELLVSGNNHLNENDIVFIENCWEVEVAKIKTVHGKNYDMQNILEFYYPLKIQHFEKTYVAKLIQHDYFIQNSAGLYVRDQTGRSDEVLANIASFNISSLQNKLTMTVAESNTADPIILTASVYNAN
ncbi:MAG: hypothetical protein V4496_07015 [Pseudomonadota bacterium]